LELLLHLLEAAPHRRRDRLAKNISATNPTPGPTTPGGTTSASCATHLKDAIQRFLCARNARCHPVAWVMASLGTLM